MVEERKREKQVDASELVGELQARRGIRMDSTIARESTTTCVLSYTKQHKQASKQARRAGVKRGDEPGQGSAET